MWVVIKLQTNTKQEIRHAHKNDASENRTRDCSEKKLPTYLALHMHYPKHWATEEAMQASKMLVFINVCRRNANIWYTFGSVKGKQKWLARKISSPRYMRKLLSQSCIFVYVILQDLFSLGKVVGSYWKTILPWGRYVMGAEGLS